mgnify:CR=1 FL=1
MAYDKIQIPADGSKIGVNPDHSLNVPERPIIPYIEGDGIGIDWKQTQSEKDKTVRRLTGAIDGLIIVSTKIPPERSRA